MVHDSPMLDESPFLVKEDPKEILPPKKVPKSILKETV
jgi:hypothetical protein